MDGVGNLISLLGTIGVGASALFMMSDGNQITLDVKKTQTDSKNSIRKNLI